MSNKSFTIIYDEVYKLLDDDNNAIRVLMHLIKMHRVKPPVEVLSVSNADICKELNIKDRTLQRLFDKLENSYKVIYRVNRQGERKIKIINKQIIDLYKLNIKPSTLESEIAFSNAKKNKQTEFYAKLNEFIENRLPPQNIRECFGNIPSKTVIFMLFLSEAVYRYTGQVFYWDGKKYGIVKALIGLVFKDKTKYYSFDSILNIVKECVVYADEDVLLQNICNTRGGLIESKKLDADYYKETLNNLYKEVK